MANILIYSGPGASPGLVANTLNLCKRLLSESYKIIETDASSLAEDYWIQSTALLILPGGRDLPYVRDLAGKANSNIKRYLVEGGRFIGFCAGAYYASGRCEFEIGTDYEVIGDRPLKFFPGICRGLAFEGFQYNSEAGARAALLKLSFPKKPYFTIPSNCPVYYNGGGAFANAEKYSNTRILATYAEKTQVDSQIAAILCTVGNSGGKAILSAVHPEYEPSLNFPEMFDKLHPYQETIENIVGNWLALLELNLNSHELIQTRIHTIYPNDEDLSFINFNSEFFYSPEKLFNVLKSHINPKNILFEDLRDNFCITSLSPLDYCFSPTTPRKPCPELEKKTLNLVLCNIFTQISWGSFQPKVYFENWFDITSTIGGYNSLEVPFFGIPLLYAEIAESTQLILDKNPKFLKSLPVGSVFVSSQQISGIGRGQNAWISNIGCLQFSLYLEHHINQSNHDLLSVDLIQYLASLAVVEAARSKKGFKELDVFLKWPNDIYALDYREVDSVNIPLKKKVGGVLVNYSLVGDTYSLIVGIGINVSNSEPTICLNDLVDQLNLRRNKNKEEFKPPLEYFTREEFLALVLVQFRKIFSQFVIDSQGLTPFLDRYYACWLHNQQVVTLKEYGNIQARILGITSNCGLLELATVQPPNLTVDPKHSKKFKLQPDSNSFDIVSGCISKKVKSNMDSFHSFLFS